MIVPISELYILKTMTTYYLFGSDAVRMYNDGSTKDVIKSGVEFATFAFIEGETKSWELAQAMDGWGDWAMIAKSEYESLQAS